MLRTSLLAKPAPPPRRTLSEAWLNLWETDPPVHPVRLGPGAPWPKTRRLGSAFLTSLLFHSAVVFFYYSIPFAALFLLFLGTSRINPTHRPMVVYEFRHLTLPPYLPALHPPGAGKAPGRGAKPGARPRLGATRFDSRITIISNPPNPDNFRVTLKTPAPPKLKLPKDVLVPDFISGGPAFAPAPPKKATPAPAPPKPPAPAPQKASIPPPPPPPPPKPVLTPVVPTSVKVAAQPPPPPPTLALPEHLPNLASAHLEVPLPPPPVIKPVQPVQQAAPAPPVQPAAPPAPASAPQSAKPAAAEASSANGSGSTPGSGPAGEAQKTGGGPEILSLSVNPIPFKDLASIPAGQLSGAFWVGPAGTVEGSPGGVPGGAPDVGEGGHGPGGDRSVAVGNGGGKPGGGGNSGPATSPAGPTVSISGPGGSGGGMAGTLPPLKPEALVFKVPPEPPKGHIPSLVVSSGSGGGGLRVFGVLHGDKVYTIYFAMPGKSWILQYCVRASAAKVDPPPHTMQLVIQPPVTPPAVTEQYGFHHAPGQDPVKNMIILHGSISEDGSVGDLTVLQGFDSTTNAAACAAFRRWKFKPALRAGVPVALDILVGIP